ncbi:MAG: hypothetical protein KME46_11830 [Brasilonema angustatum HA4187-MV1]|nr:hypothetical protein [Brasilonema angustatum HA4187-MV1]
MQNEQGIRFQNRYLLVKKIAKGAIALWGDGNEAALRPNPAALSARPEGFLEENPPGVIRAIAQG